MVQLFIKMNIENCCL